jgi:hypothetical protein
MKVITSGLAGVVVMAVSLFCASPAQAAISTMYQWNMGDNDGVTAGDPIPLTTVASVGGAGADLTGTINNSGTVITSATAALGTRLNASANGCYTNTDTTFQVVPTDNTKWGFDVVLKADSATRYQYAMAVGDYYNPSIILQTDGTYWALHRPGVSFASATAAVDTLEHHLVYAGGALYLDGTQVIAPVGGLTGFDPAAGLTIGNATPVFYNSGFAGAISYARVFQWQGEFNINDVTIPAIPEPGTVSLLAAGLFGLLGSARRKRA